MNSRVYDKFSQGYISPAIDAQIDVEAFFRFIEGGYIKFTLKRKLDTGDRSGDFVIPLEQEFDLGWAINPDTNDLLSKHGEAGSIRALIYQDGADAFEDISYVSGMAAPGLTTVTTMTVVAIVSVLAVF